jgi:peroxiredoxin
MRTLVATLVCAAALLAANASRRAPGFSLPDAKGQEHDLADFRGKVVLLEFMQTGCPHCGVFADVLNQVQQKYGDRIALLSIANPPDDLKSITGFSINHKAGWPLLLDCGQVAYSYLRTLSFDIPHVYLIDPNGGIADDFGYSEATKDIFEGKGLFPRLDAVLKTRK